MKNNKQNILLTLLLILLSAGLYTLQITVFHTPHDTAFYFLQDLAFLPLQVAIVTIVLGKLIGAWNKRERLKKINMAISAFFSEAGTEIMLELTALAENRDSFYPELDIGLSWTCTDFGKALKRLNATEFSIVCSADDFVPLKALLLRKRDFMLRMLENPNLLEHDTFTDMLLAVFHVTEEMIAREEFTGLPASDTAHLRNDIKRALKTLLIQWLSHVGHLSTDYPYLFSLEVRRNPFKDGGSVIVNE